MNWLFLNPIKDQDWGGMENWMLKLCQGLPSSGDRCLVAARPRSRWPAACERNGVPFVPFNFGFDMAPWALRRLRAICRAHQPDIVVAKGFRGARFARFAWPAAAVAVKLPFATELTDQPFEHWTYSACVDRILVDNHAARAAFLRLPWVLPNKVVTVHNGVARLEPADAARRAQLRESLGLPVDALLVGAAGRLVPEKRYADAITAFATVAPEHPARLVLFGDGPEQPALAAQIGRLGLGERVVLAGWHPDARDLMGACDAVIHPSASEGLPNIVLEAMASGVAVIATDAGGTREIIDNDGIGFLVPVGDTAALGDRLHRLLADSELRRRIGAAAREHVRSRFSIPNMVASIRQVMATACDARRALRGSPATAGPGRVWVHRTDAVVDAAAEAWDRRPDAEQVSRSRKAVVHRIRIGGRVFYTKRFCGDRLSLRWLGLRRPAALLNFRAAARVALRGTDVVPHLAACWGRGPGGGTRSLLVTGTVPDAMTADRWIDARAMHPQERMTFARSLACWMAHLHGAGIACHDLKLSNVLVHPGPEGGILFTLLDLDNCRFRSFSVSSYDARRNLHQLMRSLQEHARPREVLRFLASYRRERRMDRNTLRRLIAAAEKRMQRHGTGFTEWRAAQSKRHHA